MKVFDQVVIILTIIAVIVAATLFVRNWRAEEAMRARGFIQVQSYWRRAKCRK